MIDLNELGLDYESVDVMTLHFGPIGDSMRDEFEISVKEGINS